MNGFSEWQAGRAYEDLPDAAKLAYWGRALELSDLITVDVRGRVRAYRAWPWGDAAVGGMTS